MTGGTFIAIDSGNSSFRALHMINATDATLTGLSREARNLWPELAAP